MRVVPLGDQALLLLLDAHDPAPSAVAHAINVRHLAGVIDVVPALESVTLHIDPAAFTVQVLLDDLRRGLTHVHQLQPQHHRLPIRYDGADLAEVAATCGLTPSEVIVLHSTACYTVACVGFLPGFPYLRGLPPALHLPRRATPRTRVPAGSVAIANDQTGIYPQPSPGGWHLIGTTSVLLFDAARTPPTLLAAGDTVQFVPQ